MTREALKMALEALEAAYARLVTKCEQNLVTYNGVDVDTLTLSQEAIATIKEALAQPEQLMSDQINYGMSVTQGGKRIDPMSIYKEPEQEPVAWRYKIVDCFGRPAWTLKTPRSDTRVLESQPIYATPPQRTWVGLTDEEIDKGLLRSDYAFKTAEAWRAGVVFAMTKLKEKNAE